MRLSMCVTCQKIQNAEGVWHQAELHWRFQRGLDFSYSFCPACMVELYPELCRTILNRKTSLSESTAPR